MAESRLSRWSRLKQKGGADAREEKSVTEDRQKIVEAEADAKPEFANLPGGVQVRNFVPAMAPLAPEPEDDDDRLTRGIGHAETPEDAAAQIAEEIPEPELTDAEKDIVAGLPPLEQMTAESDFTPFLKDGVPEFMKRRALRLLWKINPFFNFRDGLNDYDEDFNVVHKVIDEMTGAYQVGRGHLSEEELRDMMPKEARRAFGGGDEEEDEDDEDAETGVDESSAAVRGEDQKISSDQQCQGEQTQKVRKRTDVADAEDAVGEGDSDPDA